MLLDSILSRLLHGAKFRVHKAGTCVAGVRDDSQVVLSNGLVNQAKRLDRMVQAFSYVLKQSPNTFFVILGREHPTEPLAGKEVVVQLFTSKRPRRDNYNSFCTQPNENLTEF